MTFVEMAGKTEKTVYFTCLDMTGNREDALDCMQETMLKAYRSFSSLRNRDLKHFIPWMRRIAANTCIDLIRRRKNTISLESMQEKGTEVPLEMPGPYEKLENAEKRRLMREAMQQLDDEARAMVIFRDVQGLSYDEIAVTLDIPLGTVKSRIFRAREKLGKILRLNGELFFTENVNRAKEGQK